jgi:hypothetical protein
MRACLPLLFCSWGDFCLFSLDTLHLLRIMPICYSQLEFPVVSGQHTISKYRRLVHLSSFWYLSSYGTKSQLVSFSLALKNCIHFSVQLTWILCLVSLMEPTGKCYLSSRFHLKLISGTQAQKYLRKCCTCLRRLAASQRPLSIKEKTVMLTTPQLRFHVEPKTQIHTNLTLKLYPFLCMHTTHLYLLVLLSTWAKKSSSR